jgi:predicted acylesterase/phospholipase RssA
VVVGTSAGSVVGALYAAGHSPFELQKLAIQLMKPLLPTGACSTVA